MDGPLAVYKLSFLAKTDGAPKQSRDQIKIQKISSPRQNLKLCNFVLKHTAAYEIGYWITVRLPIYLAYSVFILLRFTVSLFLQINKSFSRLVKIGAK